MFIAPMLLETATGPFSSKEYIFEPKIDGHRLIFSQQNNQIHLYTRHNNNCTLQYPELQVPFDRDIILDGEVACVDPLTGISDFESTMSRFQNRKADKIKQLMGSLPVFFAIFDILFYDGKDIRNWPLLKRKELLHSLRLPNSSFGIVPHLETSGEALFEQIRQRKMEGIVAKKKSTTYETGRRSASWQKVINWSTAEVFITGYRKESFGWLAAIPSGEEGRLRPAGIIELGTTPGQRKAFYAVAKQLVQGEDKQTVYLQPQIKANVRMRNWTKAGLLRNPVFTSFVL